MMHSVAFDSVQLLSNVNDYVMTGQTSTTVLHNSVRLYNSAQSIVTYAGLIKLLNIRICFTIVPTTLDGIITFQSETDTSNAIRYTSYLHSVHYTVYYYPRFVIIYEDVWIITNQWDASDKEVEEGDISGLVDVTINVPGAENVDNNITEWLNCVVD